MGTMSAQADLTTVEDIAGLQSLLFALPTKAAIVSGSIAYDKSSQKNVLYLNGDSIVEHYTDTVAGIKGLKEIEYGSDVLLTMKYAKVSTNAYSNSGQFMVMTDNTSSYILFDSELASCLSDVMESQADGYAYKSITLAAKYNINSDGMPVLGINDSTGTQSEFVAWKSLGNKPANMTFYQVKSAPDDYLGKYVTLKDNVNNKSIPLSGTDVIEGLGAKVVYIESDELGNVLSTDTIDIKVIDKFYKLAEDYTVPAAAKSITGVFVKDKGEYAIFLYGDSPIEAAPVNNDVANIGGLKSLDYGSLVTLTLSDATVNVNWNNGNFFIVSDATGAVVFDYTITSELPNFSNRKADSSSEVNASYRQVKEGEALNGTLKAIYQLNDEGTPSLTITDVDTEGSALTFSSDTTPVAEEMTIADAAKTDNFGKLVTIKKVALSGTDRLSMVAKSGSDEIGVIDFLNKLVKSSSSTYEIPTDTVDVTGIAVVRVTDGTEQMVIYPYGSSAITSGIVNVATSTTDADAPVYNLSGQRVSKATKGLFIRNGKKYIVR